MPLIRLRAVPIVATTSRGLFGDTLPTLARGSRRIGGVFLYNVPTEPIDGVQYRFRSGCFAGTLAQTFLAWDHNRSKRLADRQSGLRIIDDERALRFTATLPASADREYERVRTGVVRGLSLTASWETFEAVRQPGGIMLVRWARLIELSPVVAGAQREAGVIALSGNTSRDEAYLRLLPNIRSLEIANPRYRRKVRPRCAALEQSGRDATSPRRMTGRPQLIYAGASSGGMFGDE